MHRITEVKTIERYRLFLRWADGTEGEVDVSDLAGRGVFSVWEKPGAFENVHIGDSGELIWQDGPELCPDILYMRATGRSTVTAAR